MTQIESESGNDERNWRQDKLLTKDEIRKLEEAGYDIHEIKEDYSITRPSRCDLYKDSDGNIYVKSKGGQEPGELTDLNMDCL